MVHQWGFFGSISAIRKIWSLTANSRSLQAAALNYLEKLFLKLYEYADELRKSVRTFERILAAKYNGIRIEVDRQQIFEGKKTIGK